MAGRLIVPDTVKRNKLILTISNDVVKHFKIILGANTCREDNSPIDRQQVCINDVPITSIKIMTTEIRGETGADSTVKW